MSEITRYDCTSGGAQWCQGCYQMSEDSFGDYVKYENYEKLQAKVTELEAAARWIPVEEGLPDEGVEVRVWIPAKDDEDAFDSIDHIEEGVWYHHYSAYEHYQAVGGANAGGDDCYCTGPSEEAPYTHWQEIGPLPQPPSKGE